MQINRLFEIVYVLLNKRRVTAQELAERFQVSRRTIYRDIDTLSLAGVPVCTEKGKGGGVSLLPEFVLNKSILSETEQNEILSALQGLSSVSAIGAGDVLQKLSAIFNRSASHWLEVDFSDWSFSNGGQFNDFKSAILERRVVEFDYYSTYGEKTVRRVEPIQLWFKSRAWYIRGFCLTRQDMRLFKLSRVKNLIVTEERFAERDLTAARPALDAPERRKRDVRLVLKIAPEMAYRVFDEFCDAEKQPDGSFLVRVTWPEDEWVYGTILSYGDYIEVLSPAYMRKIIREKAEKMFEKHC